MTNTRIRSGLALLGLLFITSGLIGCGVSPREVARQTEEAYRRGYSEGMRDERERCNIETKRLKEAHREEVAKLETEVVLLKATTFSAVVVFALLLTSALIYAIVYRVRRKRRTDAEDSADWASRKPPPSVTQEP